MAIRVVIADDHEIVRIGLRVLCEDAGLQVVAEAADGDSAYKATVQHRPDLVLLDVRMPNGDGLTCLTKIKLDFPSLPVVMISGFDNPTYMARAAALGAAGYLRKESRRDELVKQIHAAVAGESLWSQEVLRRISGSLAGPASVAEPDVQLTDREREVLRHVALGLTNKEIGQALAISYETVKEHVQHILRKLGVSDRTQAAVWAVRNQMV